MDHDDHLEHLTTSVAELRPSPPRHRQFQLRGLHTALVAAAAPLTAALSSDCLRHTAAEIETEYCLSVDTVRHFYDGVDVEVETDAEYAIVRGRSGDRRRIGVGIVLLRPGDGAHTRLFGIVGAVAAAVAGGNCVILELPPSDRAIDKLVGDILTKAMDVHTFYVSPRQITSPEILSQAVLVDQSGPGPAVTPTNQFLSSSQARTVAVVDRTADVEAAAKAITTARFAFGGASPYAPDLVLVNEFVKARFFEACSRFVSGAFAGRKTVTAGEDDKNVRQAIKDAEGRGEVVSFGSDEFKLVEVLDRNSPVAKLKITGRYLPIASCSGLVDAVSSQDVNLLAGYFFASPRSAKYLSQFLPAHISVANHIPTALLLGPALPLAHDPVPELRFRYRAETFSRSRPQYIPGSAPSESKSTTDATKASTMILTTAEILVQTNPSSITSSSSQTQTQIDTQIQKIRRLAHRPLKPTGQPKTLEGLDHFASGLFLGGGIVLGVVLPAVGWASYLAWKGASGFFSSKFRR